VVEASRGEFKTGYDVLRLTLNPEPGDAVKTVFFTRKGETLYAIAPILPVGELVLEDVAASRQTEVSLLGYDEPVPWRQSGDDVVVQLPAIREQSLPSDLAFVFRLTRVEP
jgi:alpha-L-fucosidase